MKIKNIIFENKQYFETIEKIYTSDKLSVMDAHRTNRLIKKLNELNTKYDELKKKIVIQYGTLEEEEGTYKIGPENSEVFTKEYNDLINIEHDLEMEKLPFPNKIKDGFSASNLNIVEMFFDLSGLKEEKTTE
jgi:hypothetical protein